MNFHYSAQTESLRRMDQSQRESELKGKRKVIRNRFLQQNEDAPLNGHKE